MFNTEALFQDKQTVRDIYESMIRITAFSGETREEAIT